MKLFCLSLLCISTLISCSSGEEGATETLLLTFQQKLDTDSLEIEGQPKREDESAKGRFRLWLDIRGFVEADDRAFSRFDFEAGRVATWREGQAGHTSVPLLARVDFRRLELYNRTRIAGVLEETGQKMPSMDPVELEILLGIEQSRGALADRFVRAEESGDVVFRLGETEVVKITLGTTPIERASRPAWVRFVRHRLCIHPAIRGEVEVLDCFPAGLVCRWRNVGRRLTRTLTLEKTAPDPAGAPTPPASSAQNPDPLQRALKSAEGARVPSAEARVLATSRLRKRGKWLDALLGVLGAAIASGERPATEIRDLMVAAPDKTPLTQLVTRLAGLNDPDRASALREGLGNLRQRDLENAFVCDIWRANASVTLAEPEAAIGYLLDVLTGHPEMTGAWSDLGWIYHRAFQVEKAWLCFETALRLAPQHPMLVQVKELEGELREGYPEFFE